MTPQCQDVFLIRSRDFEWKFIKNNNGEFIDKHRMFNSFKRTKRFGTLNYRYYNWEVVRGPSVQRHDKIGNCRRYRYVHEINLQTQELIMLVLNLTNDAFLPISIFHVASGSWNLNPSLCGHGHPMLLELLKFSSIFQQSTRQIREAKVALHPIRQGK